MNQLTSRKRSLQSIAHLLMAIVVYASVCSSLTTQAIGDPQAPGWAVPQAMALRRVSTVTAAQSAPNFLENLDCSLLTYRVVASSTMQTGCFTETAYGMLDSDSDMVIYNGTDEALPLLTYSPHEILVPWPGSLDLVALDTVNTGGAYISLYKNPLAVTQDQRNLLGQLTAKQLTKPPELPLKDPSGQRLVINVQTITFSDGGSWLVAETLNGSFVRINLATLEVTAFAPAFNAPGIPASFPSRVAISDNGHFVAIGNEASTSLKVYDLTTCNGVVHDLQPQNCQSYDYRPFVNTRLSGLRSIRHIRFINEGLLSFEATTSDPADTGIYVLAPTENITSLTDYVGLGDSYTSGEGAFDYLAGTDTDTNKCHLSRRSYPLLLTDDLFSARGGHSVACSGAVISDVGSTSDGYKGQVKQGFTLQQLQQTQPLLLESIETNFLPGYLAQQRFVKRWQPRIVTVSVGGDDIGFSNILQTCVAPHISRHESDNTCFNTYEDRLELLKAIDSNVRRWTDLYKQLKNAAPGITVYALGYPQIIDDTGNCALNVQLSKSEQEFAEELIVYLDKSIQQAASTAGVSYIDISQALHGYRLCETAGYSVAMNGLTAGNDGGPFGTKMFGQESYHPNAFGQTLIEQTILQQTHNLTSGLAQNTTNNTPDSSPLLSNAPKTNRPLNTRIPDTNLTNGVGKRGSNTAVTTDGVRNGLKPNTLYTIKLDGANGTTLTTISSNDSGDIATMIVIPTATTPGGHTIDVIGGNQTGETVDITQPIYVPASDTDSDGDGIEDMLDTCPGAINSGQDADQDGTDDVCDVLIGPPPPIATNPPPSPSNPSLDVTSGNSSTTGLVGSDNTAQSTVLPPATSNIPVQVDPIASLVQRSSPDSHISELSAGFNPQVTMAMTSFAPGTRTATVRSENQQVTTTASTKKQALELPRSRSEARYNASPLYPVSQLHKPPVAFRHLRTFTWLPWIILPLLFLLLLLLISFCLNRLIKPTATPFAYHNHS